MNNRVPTNYIVTREQKRYIAKENMKKAGIKNFCKHSFAVIKHGFFTTQFTTQIKEPSYFAKHWKEYIGEVTA